MLDLTRATRDEMYAEAKRLDIEGRSKMTKDELAHALTLVYAIEAKMVKDRAAYEERTSDNPIVKALDPDSLIGTECIVTVTPPKTDPLETCDGEDCDECTDYETGRALERALNTTNIQYMSGLDKLARLVGLKRIDKLRKIKHGRHLYVHGRALGAKHYPTSRQIEAQNRHEVRSFVGAGDGEKPLSKNARVKNYARQNGQPGSTADSFPGALLTPKQWKRTIKKENHASKNGKTFLTKGRV